MAGLFFLSTIFNKIELKPLNGFSLKNMPKRFVDTGHGLIDLVIDATILKFGHVPNFNLIYLTFSNNKTTVLSLVKL